MDRRGLLAAAAAGLTGALVHGGCSVARGQEPWMALPRPASLPAGGVAGRISHDGASLYYKTFGSGPPVILLHGGLADGRYWGDQVPALLNAGYQAILMDSRGHGKSSRDGRPFTYELMQSDVVALMDHLHLPKASIVGWSDGAIIGLVMALRAPDRLTRVFAFAANMDPSGVKSDTAAQPVFAQFERQSAADYQGLSPTPKDFKAFSDAVNQMWNTEPNYKPVDLAKIHTPVAIVDGDHDEAIKLDHTEYLARTIPNAKLIIIPNASHFAMLQQPEAFNAAMLAFLKTKA